MTMTIREVYNPNTHEWERVPNFTFRQFLRQWFARVNWSEQQVQAQKRAEQAFGAGRVDREPSGYNE